jgi:hypothetical protein
MHIACLHTAESNVAVFDSALLQLGPSDPTTLHHEVRADLLADAERAGGLTPEIAERTREALVGLRRRADAVVLTCSTLGPAVDGFDDDGPSSPVLRVDTVALAQASMAGAAVAAVGASVLTSPIAGLRDAIARIAEVRSTRDRGPEALRVACGEESIGRFASSPGITRCFCKVCGSSLYTLRADLGRAHIRLGTVDGDPGVRPSRHVYVGSKAPWFEITDSLPQHESSSVTAEGPPRAEPAQGT